MAYQSFFWSSEETFNIKSLEIAQTTENIWNFIVIKSNLPENANFSISGRIQTLIWRPGETVQNRESPGLSGRVDSTDLNLLHYKVSTVAFARTPERLSRNFQCLRLSGWFMYKNSVAFWPLLWCIPMANKSLVNLWKCFYYYYFLSLFSYKKTAEV